MKRVNSKNRTTPLKKKVIIEAALSCFAELGYDQTGMEDIRKRSGASTGSIYHHFKSKERLAASVYLEGIRHYQEGFLTALLAEQDARAGVHAVVTYHLKWIEDHPQWAFFLFRQRHAEFMAQSQEEFSRINTDFFGRIALWFGDRIRAGTFRRLPVDLYPALLIGPCQEYSRMRLAGHTRANPGEVANDLAEAVWRAIGAERETNPAHPG